MKKLWDKYIRQPIENWWARLRAKIDPPAPAEPPIVPTTPSATTSDAWSHARQLLDIRIPPGEASDSSPIDTSRQHIFR